MASHWILLAISVVVFVASFRWSNVAPAAGRAISTISEAAGAMRAADLDELAKEKLIRAAALRLCGLSVTLFFRGMLVLVVTALPMILVDRLGIIPLTDSLAFMTSWKAIGAATAAVCIAYAVTRRP